jgi:hypothetical protein
VVFSMDLTTTRNLDVIGELASLRGLKFRIALSILGAIGGLVRMRIDIEFKVASISMASLTGSATLRVIAQGD